MPDVARQRVLIVHSSDELYGADRILLHVVAAMCDLDVDFEVWLPSDVDHGPYPLCSVLEEQGVRWRHLELPILRRASLHPIGLLTLVRAALRTTMALRRERFDLVYLSSSACLFVAPLARITGAPRRVLHIQERWEGRSASALRWLARWTTSRVAISRYVAVTAGLGDPLPIVVENVVEDASGRVVPAEFRTGGPLRFVVASRWNRWKGHQTLFAAWASADCPGTLTVLGGRPSSGEAIDVPSLVAALPQPDSVRLVGEVADIAPYLAEADVLILPSDDPEPFGLVVIEAFSLGRPVISSRAGGPLDVIEHGVSGWFFEPGNVESLAGALAVLDIDDVREAGLRAREAYEARFRPERFRAELGAVLTSELAAG